jgi:tetratricopeptide (TPR) repeat protein
VALSFFLSDVPPPRDSGLQRALPIAAGIFVAGLLLFALTRLEGTQTPVTDPVAPEAVAAPEPAPVEDPALHDLDVRIASFRARAEQRADDWLNWEFVALGYLDRASITGSYEDYREAELAIDHAFVGGAAHDMGPFLTRAMLNSSMHRVARVEADLVLAERGYLISRGDRDAIRSLRADALFYSGRYDDARALYAAQLADGRSVASLVAMAQLEWRTGHFDAAAPLLDETVTLEEGDAMRAWALSARAMMERDRGQLEAALTAIRAARALSPEDAHLDQIFAEILELRGNDAAALERFQSIAARTESPQAMDGAARILRAQGDTIGADELVTAARQSYEAQIAIFPEAAYGHAIDHWLRLEDDLERTVASAEGNAEARPYGETRTKLAIAYLLAARPDDAARELDETIESGWESADTHAVRAIAAERLGDAARAETERAAAEAIAPGITDRLGWLSR